MGRVIDINRWQMALRWAFGLAGSYNPPLAEEIVATMVLENDRFEQRIGRGELTFGGVGGVAALAGNIGQVGLLIPADSGVVVTIEEIWNLNVANQLRIRRQYGGAGAGAGSPIGFDTRMGSSTVPACQLISTVNGAAIGTALYTIPGGQKLEREIAMAASKSASVVIWVSGEVVNQNVDVSIRWRERPLESGLLS